MGDFNRYEVQPSIPGPTAPEVTSSEQPQEKPQERPSWLPEKFWKDGKADTEGLAKSYSELEKRGGKPSGEPHVEEKPNGEQTPKAGEPHVEEKPNGEQTPKAPDKPTPTAIPGVNQEQSTKYWGELTKDGKLSDDSYAELEKSGYPKALVDTYIKGIQNDQTAVDNAKAVADAQVVKVKGIAGGEQGYAVMVEWIAATQTPQEIAAYDAAMNSGDMAKIDLAVRGMHAKYTQANGSEPSLLGGSNGNGQTAGDVFKSTVELQEAMKDRRYKTDAGYRKEVSDRLSRSNIM